RGRRRPQAVWFARNYGGFRHARATQRVGVDGFWGFCGEEEELRRGVAKIGASTEGGLGWPVRVVPVSGWWWLRWPWRPPSCPAWPEPPPRRPRPSPTSPARWPPSRARPRPTTTRLAT